MLAFSSSLSAPIRQQPHVLCQGTPVMWTVSYPSHILGSLQVYVNTIVLWRGPYGVPIPVLGTSLARTFALSVCQYDCLVTWALDNAPRYGVYNQTRDLSGQSLFFVTYLYAGISNHPAVDIGMSRVLPIHWCKGQTVITLADNVVLQWMRSECYVVY